MAPSDSPPNSPNNNPNEKKFTDYREIRGLIKEVHPDTTGSAPEEIKKLGEVLTKILVVPLSKKTVDWEPDFLADILTGKQGDVQLIRKNTGDQWEVSDPIRVPRNARAFFLAFDAFLKGKSWDEVKLILSRKPSESGVDSAQIEELENATIRIQTFDDAGKMAEKIMTRLSRANSQTRVMRIVHRIVEQLVENKTKNLTQLAQLAPVQVELRAFAAAPYAQYFLPSMFFDFIDAAALRIGRQMIADTRSPDELQKALAAIHNYDFRYAEAYTAPFAESREDALAKIDFLNKLRNKRSEAGLDDLRKDVEAFEFKATDMADQYRAQIFSFIERKREVYWPKEQRSKMPKP